jgi:hypothetical protein
MHHEETQKNYIILTNEKTIIQELARGLFILGSKLEFLPNQKSKYLKTCSLYDRCFVPETGFYISKLAFELHQCRDLLQLISQMQIGLSTNTKLQLEGSITKHFKLIEIIKGGLESIQLNRSLVVGHLNLCTEKEFVPSEGGDF